MQVFCSFILCVIVKYVSAYDHVDKDLFELN